MRYQRLSLALALGMIPALSFASLSETAFQVVASNVNGTSTFSVNRDALSYNPGTDSFSWSLGESQELYSSSGRYIATINAASLNYVQDPVVNLFFSVQAGGVVTTFTVTSALLSFAAINPAEGRATAGMSITDTDNNGVTMNGLEGGKAYSSYYNGFVPAGTLFKTLVAGFNAPAGQSNTGSENFGWVNIGGAVTDMSARFNFDLTANDLASGTSNYEIRAVPEPTTIAALALGAGALLLRRKRK